MKEKEYQTTDPHDEPNTYEPNTNSDEINVTRINPEVDRFTEQMMGRLFNQIEPLPLDESNDMPELLTPESSIATEDMQDWADLNDALAEEDDEDNEDSDWVPPSDNDYSGYDLALQPDDISDDSSATESEEEVVDEEEQAGGGYSFLVENNISGNPEVMGYDDFKPPLFNHEIAIQNGGGFYPDFNQPNVGGQMVYSSYDDNKPIFSQKVENYY